MQSTVERMQLTVDDPCDWSGRRLPIRFSIEGRCDHDFARRLQEFFRSQQGPMRESEDPGTSGLGPPAYEGRLLPSKR